MQAKAIADAEAEAKKQKQRQFYMWTCVIVTLILIGTTVGIIFYAQPQDHTNVTPGDLTIYSTELYGPTINGATSFDDL